MNPHDYLDLAEEWIEGDTEGHWRSAVSRAYYAAFHAARGFLRRNRFSVPREQAAHAYLIHRLSNSGHASVNDAGKALDRLRTQRNIADYDWDIGFPQWEAEGFVESARHIIETLEAVEADAAVRAVVVAGIVAYERTRREVTYRG